ncbi:MAG: hypothetical protein WC586_01530 [Methanoregula sp.]
MPGDKIPCCAADALWRIRKIRINGMMTGITMLNESIAAVLDEKPAGDTAVRAALMKRIRACNYIPPATEEAYTDALMEEYNQFIKKQEEKAG